MRLVTAVPGEMIMFSEYDVISLQVASKNMRVPVGTHGTVLIVYPGTPPAYEVEFIGDSGESFGTYTMEESDLKLEQKA